MQSTQLLARTFLGLSVIAWSFLLSISGAQEPATQTEKSPLAQQFAEWETKVEKLRKTYEEDLIPLREEAKVDLQSPYNGRLNARNLKYGQDWTQAIGALADLVKSNPSNPACVDGILLYLKHYHSFDKVPEFKSILLDRQFTNPRMATLCARLHEFEFDKDAVAILKEVAKRHPAAKVRGIATYSLGEMDRRVARGWDPHSRDYPLSIAEQDKLLARAAQRFQQVLDQYAHETYVDGKRELRDLAGPALTWVKNFPNLRVGEPAPDIAGTDLDGKPLKISDYRGKVVALVFWGSWCGPCMDLVPQERELVERMKGKPFVLIGVNSNDTLEKAKQVVAENQMEWTSVWDGAVPQGPFALAYNVDVWPSVFVIDAQGVIRHTQAGGDKLDKVIDALVAEVERK